MATGKHDNGCNGNMALSLDWRAPDQADSVQTVEPALHARRTTNLNTERNFDPLVKQGTSALGASMRLVRLRTLAVLSLRLGLVVCAALAFAIGRYLYLGTASPGIPSKPSVSCGSDAGSGYPCNVRLQDLGAGRWRVTVAGHGGGPVTILLLPNEQSQNPGTLLIRRGFDCSGKPSASQIMVVQGTSTSLSPPTPANQPGPRQVIPLDHHPIPGTAVEVKVQAADPADSEKPLIVDEIGLFASSLGINSLFGGYEIRSDQREASVDLVRYLLLVTIALAIALALAVGPSARRWVAYASGLAVGVAALVILVDTNGPEWAADLRLMIGAGALLEFPGSNLNYGMYLADSVMGGHGPVVSGSPMWNRMPGYPYFLALSWAPNDLLMIGLRSVFLQIALLMVGLAALTFTLARLVGPVIAALVGAILRPLLPT